MSITVIATGTTATGMAITGVPDVVAVRGPDTIIAGHTTIAIAIGTIGAIVAVIVARLDSATIATLETAAADTRHAIATMIAGAAPTTAVAAEMMATPVLTIVATGKQMAIIRQGTDIAAIRPTVAAQDRQTTTALLSDLEVPGRVLTRSAVERGRLKI